MQAESLYKRLPIPLQNLAASLEGWRILRGRYGRSFDQVLREVEERGRSDGHSLCQFRDERLRSFLSDAVREVPAYTGFRLCAEDIRGLEDLGGFPVLHKATVQAALSEFQSQTRERWAKFVTVHTSGTTGAGLRFRSTRSGVQEQWAVWWRYRRWHGIELDTWCGYFGGRSVVSLEQKERPFWRYNFPGKQILFSGYHMAPDYLGAYVDELRKRRPPWLHGYPSLLALLAGFIVDRNVDLGYQLRWITTGAESLLLQQAQVIERAFGVKPRQHYGLAEAVANFSECEHGVLHIDEDFAATEFVPEGDGRSCRIVGTNLSNPLTPLIRYDTGDLATLGEGPCPCERAGRIVTAVDGRREDYVVLPNGARVGRMDHVFKDLVNIRDAQIYQPRVGRIEVRVVRGSRYGEDDEAALLAELRQRVGSDTWIDVEYVDALERSRTGKLRLVVSDVEGARLEQMQTL